MKIIRNIKTIMYVSKLNYKKLIIYKSANASGLIVNLFWLLVQANVLVAFIRNGVSHYSLEQGVGYMIMMEALLVITGLGGCLGGINVDSMLKSGNIVQYLLNPLGFIQYIIGMEIGRVLYYLFWRSIPIFIVGCFMLQWFPKITVYQSFLFGTSIILAIILSNMLQFMVTISAIKYQTTNGIIDLYMAIALFFSGGLLPLDFFPTGLYEVAMLLPFSAQIYLPVSIILGTGGHYEHLLLLEIIWIIIMMLISYNLYSKERRNLLVQGG